LLVAGLGTLFGLGAAHPFILAIFSLGAGWLIASRATGKYFLHGLLVGLFYSVWFSLVQAYYLFDMKRVGMVEVEPFGLDPQLINLLAGVSMGVISGVVIGILALVFAKVVRKDNRVAS
jgi:hypothetical protein